MSQNSSLAARVLAELDADPGLAALRRRAGAAATPECEFRALRGAWAAAVLRAATRAAVAALAAAVASRPAGLWR